MVVLGKVLVDQLVETLDELRKLEEVRASDKPSYRVYCPGCGASVIRHELLEKGCYLCHWAPAPTPSPATP